LNADDLKQYEPQPTGVTLTHDRQLWQSRYSPCGRFLLASSYDASIQRWDVTGEAPKLLSALTGHNGWVQCLDFAGGSQRAFTADSWGKLRCWPYAEADPQPTWEQAEAHDGWIRGLAVSPDGQQVATAGNDKTVRLWSAADGKLQSTLNHPQRVDSVVFHPEGKSLATGDLKGVIRHWDLAGEKVERTLDAGLLYQLHRIQECGGARLLSFNAGGNKIACAGQKQPEGGFATGTPCVLVFDWDTGKLIREMPMGGTQDGFAYEARFHPDGFVMCASCAFPGKGHIWFWRPEEDKPFYSSNKIPNGRSLSLHPDGHHLAITVSLAPNGNGRNLKDGEYPGGSGKIIFAAFAGIAEPAKT
jgi:WD40 repeat protein